MPRTRVSCFIDGFNLYHAISDIDKPWKFDGNNWVSRKQYLKWVNLRGLAESFINNSADNLEDVFYFTALAYWRAKDKIRHQSYMSALGYYDVTTVLGSFKEKTKGCRACGASWKDHEEKESDVNLALYILNEAHKNTFDKALVVTADSDIGPAINLVLDQFPDKIVEILVPPKRFNITKGLRHRVRAHRIKEKHLKNNLLPEEIIGGDGNLVAKRPAKYDP